MRSGGMLLLWPLPSRNLLSSSNSSTWTPRMRLKLPAPPSLPYTAADGPAHGPSTPQPANLPTDPPTSLPTPLPASPPSPAPTVLLTALPTTQPTELPTTAFGAAHYEAHTASVGPAHASANASALVGSVPTTHTEGLGQIELTGRLSCTSCMGTCLEWQ